LPKNHLRPIREFKALITIAVLPGDGIGVEVTKAAIPIFAALNIPVQLNFGDIGWTFWQNEGCAIPERTWQLIRQSDTVLLGATTSKPNREALEELGEAFRQKQPAYLSPIIQLRQQLDLFANVRPCFNIKNEGKEFNFTVIRENTEGLYAGFDYHPIPPELTSLLATKPAWGNLDPKELSCSLRLQTKKGLLRLFEFAFQYAKKQKMQRVTLADKPNVLRQSGAFTREIFEEIASHYPHIKADILNVDAVALWMIRRPEDFGVIVAENMFGDILSDVGAGIMGGLGLAPSANIGEKGCYFEPVHGSAPKIMANRANPGAMFLTIALLLRHFGYSSEADLIKQALTKVVQAREYVTYDLGGNSSTEEMAGAILRAATI
jgi:isocitrate/isopropylmalate dehydrogenase